MQINSSLPSLEISDVFEKYDHLLGRMPKEHREVVQAIKNCRTGALGGRRLQCNSCDYEKIAYNSCRNRHCGKCGFTARTQWVEKRCDELLPCEYFHAVFTLPSELRPLMLRNKKLSYNLLFKAASETLKQVAKKSSKLEVDIGFIGVLHTWNQTLIDHPHIHCLIPGGGLSKDKTQWVTYKENFLLPVKVLSEVFRGKIIQLFEDNFNTGNFNFMGDIDYLSHPGNFKELLFKLAEKNFNVYCKKPFAGPEQVLKYLGQYTHKIAISNYRLVKMEDDKVHFKYRDPKDAKNKKIMVLHVKEFMRRFLLHVLPKRFARIRHFGVLGNRFKKIKIALIKSILKIKESVKETTVSTWKEILKSIMGTDPDKCSSCKVGILRETHLFKAFYNTA